MRSPVRVETPYDGRLFKVQVLTFEKHGRSFKREVVKHPGAVLIIPALDAETVVMIRNHRVAVGEQLWEFPAGKLEPDEKPDVAAARELEEETGYTSKSMRKLGAFYTSPGFTDELMHAYVAENLTFVGQRLEDGEDIETQKVPLREAIQMIHDGRLKDGKSIAGLLMWRSCLP